MRRFLVLSLIVLTGATIPALAQANGDDTASASAATDQENPGNASAAANPVPTPAAAVTPKPAVQPNPAPQASLPSAAKQDALVLYRQGRDLETEGRTAEAQAKYNQSVSICDREISDNPKRIDAYVVKCWSLFRLNRYADVVATAQTSTNIAFDSRISEVMGESYYFLGNMDQSIKALQKYLEVEGDDGDRGPTALFFLGEAYLRQKKFAHADIAYSTAILKEPSMSRWWFRLGSVCEIEGEYQRAYDAYAKAISLSPGYQDAVEAQARVKPKLGAN